MRPFFAALIALLALSSAPAFSQERFKPTDPDALRVVRTDSPATAASLREGGARLVADYGAYQLFEAAPAVLDEAGVEDVTYQARIELHAGFVDSRRAEARTARARALPERGRRLHLVQFAGPVRPEWLEALEKTGVRVVDYIPHNAYLVYGDRRALAAVQLLARRAETPLRFEGAFLDGDKINPRARKAAAEGKSPRNTPDTDLFQIQLVLDDEANPETLLLIESLKLEPIRRTRRVPDQYLNIIVRLPPAALDAIAAQADVISIWPYVVPKKRDERQSIIVSGQLSGNNPAGPGYLQWLADRGFTQAQFDTSGLVVDVTDSGLDNGTTNPNHFALFRLGTTANVARVRYNRLEGSANSGSTVAGCDGHGNINAHIIGGYVALSNAPHTDAQGYRYGLGVAPFVKVGGSVIFDPSNFTFPEYDDLASRAYRDGARVSGNSWGADTAGGYDADAQNYDRLVRDAQPTTAAVSSNGNQQMTFFFAAGNAGSGAQTVGSPGTAKNVITVGAAENVHAFGGADGCGTTDTEANSANDMATFSSRGPCADGRRKPEIVAPGTHVSGGVAQQTRTMSGTGDNLACYNGEGVCGGAGSIYHPSGQQFYTASSGTSHSTPALAGGGALVYQWFINQFGIPPSPAMIKAFLVAGARYMNGTGANDTLWSNSQGFGMMNLGMNFDGTPRFLRDQVTNELFTASGQTRTYTGSIVSNSKPFRVTLTWTDAPGSTSGNAYRNDINLTVAVNGQTYRGNVFSGQYSTTGGSADFRNNTESVFLPAGTTGSVVITVSAANINSDGVPDFGTGLDQDFALVAYNFSEIQAPAVVLAGSEITDESCGLGNGALDPGETVTVKFTLQNIGSAPTTNVVATLLATGGVTAPTAAQNYGALGVGGATVTNAFTFTATGTCGGAVTATLSLQDGGASLGAVVQTFTLGGLLTATVTNANPAAITIVDNAVASPYPSTINVSGVAGPITKVTATLLGFTHTWPEDIDVLLVGPGGQSVALMGAVGGGTDANNVTLTFDDAAGGAIGASVVSGTFKPSGSISAMTAPAPAGPYGSELAAFNGTTANGTWSLYVLDAAAADTGNIAGGWRLAITAGEPLCCGSNQPPILASIGNKTVAESNTLTFAVTALDPSDGDPVTLGASNLPPGAVFTTVTNAGGVTNSFNWTTATPSGVYTTLFYAVDKDGAATESILITVQAAGVGGVTNYIVNFEGVGETKTAYASGSVTLSGISWTLAEALIGTDGNDRKNGLRSARMRDTDSSMTMAADTTGSVGTVSFLHGKYGSDANSALALDYSTNSGSTWINAGTVSVSSTTLTLYSTNLGIASTARLRIRKTSGSGDSNRASVDDIIITSAGGGGPPAQSPPTLAAIGPQSVLVSNTLAFTIVATPTDGDPLALTASNLPPGAVFSATNTLGYFTWSVAAPVGVYTTAFFAADDDGAASESVTITVYATGGEATETFSNLNAPGGSYGSGSYVGDGGITWTYSGARSESTTYAIDGLTLGFGDSTRDPREILSDPIPGGVGTLSIKYLKYFTGSGTRSFDIYVNTQLVGSVSDANNTTVQTQFIAGINIPGTVQLKLVGTGGKQVAVDSLTWTGYDAAPDPDADGDGIPDAYENEVFGSTTNIGIGTDWDGDGFLDVDEYRAGTSTTNPASLLQLESTATAPAGEVVIRWQSATGRIYGVSRSTNLLSGFNPLATNLSAFPPENVWTDAAPPAAGGHYRIDLEAP